MNQEVVDKQLQAEQEEGDIAFLTSLFGDHFGMADIVCDGVGI